MKRLKKLVTFIIAVLIGVVLLAFPLYMGVDAMGVYETDCERTFEWLHMGEATMIGRVFAFIGGFFTGLIGVVLTIGIPAGVIAAAYAILSPSTKKK